MKNHARPSKKRESCGTHLRSRSPFRSHSVALAILFAICSTIVSTIVPTIPEARADDHRLRVRGGSRVETHTSNDRGELVFRGTLLDDAGEPLGDERIRIRLTKEDAGSDANANANPGTNGTVDATLAAGLRHARACTSITGNGVRVEDTADDGAPTLIATTDEGGRFCFRAALSKDRYRATVMWKGSDLIDGATNDVVFDLGRVGLSLHFDPVPHVITLDDPESTIGVDAWLDDDGTTRSAEGLELTLTNERGERLAKERTNRSGNASFRVATNTMGGVGPGELRVSFEGNDDVAKASQTAVVERAARVVMNVEGDARTRTALVPEDGIPVRVRVTAHGKNVDEGAVEARVDDRLVGAAKVSHGIAALSLTFSAQGSEAVVRLRYVSGVRWLEAPDDVLLTLPIRSSGPLLKIVVLVTGAFMLAFFFLGRLASGRTKPTPVSSGAENAPIEAVPRVVMLQPADSTIAGFRGRVVDAHVGVPVAFADVWIERASFDGVTILARTRTDASGHFELAGPVERTSGERLVAEGRLHERLTQNLPASGELLVTLVSRKRAILARLVAWARKEGPPFDAPPEPTPGHVERAAIDRPETARWANEVERAAFGYEDVDARREEELAALAPRVESP